MKNLIALVIIVTSFSSAFSQTKHDSTVDSIVAQKTKLSVLSVAFLPTIIFPKDGSMDSYYSTGYGFTVNTSYKVLSNISISGNIEFILSHFKITDMFDSRSDYETTSRWISVFIGPKIYLNNSSSRIYLNSNMRLIYVYHGTSYTGYYLPESPETAFGVDFGFGVETPINKDLTLEINPGYNILLPGRHANTLKYESEYFRIAVGLRHNL